MNNNTKKQLITKALFSWYNTNQRAHLPWRQTRNPYYILVSEVMLQQTQVERVIIKYHEFLTAFPTTKALASAKTSDIIKTWKGLGYNRRALFLQKTAIAVETDFGGVFPQDIATLKTLPGVGDYTARAILSFAFEQLVPMMDTNHRRFYQRVFFGLEAHKDKELLAYAETILPKRKAYDWNQALMDFGSLVCTTRNPKCEDCPLIQYCAAYPEILSVDFSQKKVKKKKTIPFKETDRFIRGRVIDYLREHDRGEYLTIRELFDHVTDERFARVAQKLEKDGLIKRQKDVMLLP